MNSVNRCRRVAQSTAPVDAIPNLAGAYWLLDEIALIQLYEKRVAPGELNWSCALIGPTL